MSESAKKEFRELTKLILKNGYKVVPGGKRGRGKGKGHYHILDAKGRKVIDENGPVVLSGSPGDFRARDLAAARLIRAGVLKSEQLPWKPMKPKADGLLLGDAEEEETPERELSEKQRERIKRENDQRTRHERTQQIRGDLEPIIRSLGGWTKRGMIAEMASVVYHHAKDSPWGFPSVAAARANATNLRAGGTLSDDYATAWQGLIETLQMAEMEGKLREAWFDLVRAARGLPARNMPVVSYQPGGAVEGDGPSAVSFGGGDGSILEGLEREYGGNGERWSKRYPEEEHPLYTMHANGGVKWPIEMTDDDLNELSQALGFFEGLAVTRRVAVNGIELEFFEGQELAEPSLARLRALVTKISEARFRELDKRDQVARKG